MKLKILCLIALLSLVGAGCGPEGQMSKAKSLEKAGKYYKAWEKYQELAASSPQSPIAPEAVFRAGWLAQRHFDDCFMASTFYDEVLTRYPDSEPWAKAALLQKNSCPDYFPLVAGSSWTEVDSDTKGNNARIEIECLAIGTDSSGFPSQSGKMRKNYYAGNKKSLSTESIYNKTQQELLEMKPGQENASSVMIKWPIEVGTKWVNRVEGKSTTFEIASLDTKISVAAGDFPECLQVRSYTAGDSVVKNEYYAPGVGRVLTSITTSKGEKRITELSTFKIIDAPAFSIDEKKQ